jgi:hypothetical protein
MVAASARLFRLNAGVYFFTVNSNIFRRVNADSDLSATNAEHGDLDLASNGDGFADATGQYQHAIPLNWFRKYQGTNTPEMGLALLIVIHRTHRLGALTSHGRAPISRAATTASLQGTYGERVTRKANGGLQGAWGSCANPFRNSHHSARSNVIASPRPPPRPFL